MKGKKQYWAVLVVKEAGIYTVLKKKSFSPINSTIRFNEKLSYPITSNTPTYQKGMDLYYLFEKNSGLMLLGEGSESDLMKPEIMDMIMGKSIIKQLTENLTDKMDYSMIVLIFSIGAIMGGLVGFIISLFTTGVI